MTPATTTPQPAGPRPSDAESPTSPSSGSASKPARRRDRVRQWFEARATGPAAVPTLAVLCFLDACVSPIVPELLLLPMTVARRHSVAFLTAICAVASVVGGIFGYLLGALAWDSGLDQLFYEWVPGFTPAGFAEVSERFGSAAFLVVFLAGFTPLPFKLFTIAAGVCHTEVPFVTFLAASITSRSLKFWLEIWILQRFGPPLLDLVFKRLGLLVAVLLGAALAWWLLGG